MTENTKELEYVTQEDLDKFKDAIVNELNERFDEFIDDFVAVMMKTKPDDNELDEEENCACNEIPENLVKYVIYSGGNKYFASEIKPNSIYGVDFYLHEVDEKTGKEYNSQGTITSADIVIIDLKPDIKLETFRAIKQNCLDYVIQQAQEAKVREEANKKTITVPKDVNVMSYN